MSKFYEFKQNNTGGSFVISEPEGLTVHVIIEADNADEANAIAEQKGIYFDGCDSGNDCPCCGDRWYRVCEGDGSVKPSVYGDALEENRSIHLYGWAPEGMEICVHYKNGSIEWFGADGSASERTA